MRLITLSLFAFLLAVPAFGQDYMAAVGIFTRVEYRGASPGFPKPGSASLPPRQCSGLALTPTWVLTAGHCVFSDVGVNAKLAIVYGADGSAQRPLKIVAEADPEYHSTVWDDRTLGNLALIHTACSVTDRTAQPVYVSTWVVGEGGVSRLVENFGTPNVEVDVTPYPRVNPDTGNIDRWRPPDDERSRSGLAQKVNDVWTFQSSGEPLPEDVVDGSPVWVWAHRGHDAGGAVGIYTGEVDGVPTFVDLSTKWEWISKTVRDETIILPELCRAR